MVVVAGGGGGGGGVEMAGSIVLSVGNDGG